MDNETNKTSSEEEYRPTEYDSSVFDASPAASSIHGGDTSRNADNRAVNFLEHLKRKNIIIAIGVLVGIFCVYKIVDVLFTPSAPPRHKTTAHAQAQMPKPIIQSPQSAAVNAAAASQNQASIAAAPVINRLNSLEQQMNNERTDVTRLNNQMNDLQTSLSNMDAKLSNLTASLQMLADEMVKQQARLAAKQIARKKAIAAAPRPIYYVKAMVPGRAWLAGQDGRTVTVSLGNNLPGYGSVEAIDPSQGTLITSSGAIIGYSSDDS